MESKSQDDWKKYFRSANTSIYTIIENAITVAASDNPKEFALRRGMIAEKIYSCTLPNCCCNDDSMLDSKEKECKSRRNCNDLVVCDDEKISPNPNNEERMCVDKISKYSYGEVEALTDAMEEQSAVIDDVKRIKESLENSEPQTETEIIESLRKLQIMVHSAQVLEETLIGATVNRLSKHWSKHTRQFAKTLVTSWMTMQEEYCKFTNNLEEDQSKDPNLSLRDDYVGGLPIPPMDEGIFLLSHQPPTDLSQFFNGIDDNGNPEESHEAEKIHESKSNAPRGNKRKPELQLGDNCGQIKEAEREAHEKLISPTNEERDHPSTLAENKRNPTSKRHEGTTSVSTSRRQNPKNEFRDKSAKPRYYTPSESDNSQKRLKQQKLLLEAENEGEIHKKMDKDKVHQNAKVAQKIPAEAHAVETKLEMSKRKLYQRYQEADKARSCTKVIVDLPKDAFNRRNSGWNRKKYKAL